MKNYQRAFVSQWRLVLSGEAPDGVRSFVRVKKSPPVGDKSSLVSFLYFNSVRVN